jgi:hypothetical protein
MAEPDRITDMDDSALDALLSTLTEPGEDPAFRARVLSRLDGSVDDARTSPPWRWAAAGVLVAAALVVAMFYGWRPQRPVGDDAERAAVESAPAASSAGGAMVRTDSSATPGRDASTGLAAEAPAEPWTTSDRRSRAAVREPQVVAAREALADDQPLPYGIERIRLEPVSIQPFALREVREDPAMAALIPPDPVRVDPIDIDEITPRR